MIDDDSIPHGGPGWFSRYSDSLRAGRPGDRIPVGARFSVPVQNGPGAHPPYYKMGAGSFPWTKRPGCGVDYPLPSSAEVKERLELYLYSTSGTSWHVKGWSLPLPLLLVYRMGGIMPVKSSDKNLIVIYEYVFVKRDRIKSNEISFSCSRGIACVRTRRHLSAVVNRHAFRKTCFERTEHGLPSVLLQNKRYRYG